MKFLLAPVLVLVFAMNIHGQVDAVDRFLKNNPGLRTFYIYQSTLRMLNEEGDRDFNMLIKDLRKVNIYVARSGGQVSDKTYDLLVRRLEEEGFEYLISAGFNGNDTHLLTKIINRDPYYILSMRSDEGFALMEMDGQINLAYLGVIENIDLNRLNELIMDTGSMDFD